MADEKHTAIYTAYDDNEQPEIFVPERNLLRAVLLNAIADLRRPGDYQRKAMDYFLSKEDDYIFSFQSVCSYLNIDPFQILILVGLDNGRPKSPPPHLEVGVEQLLPSGE